MNYIQNTETIFYYHMAVVTEFAMYNRFGTEDHIISIYQFLKTAGCEVICVILGR